MGDYVFYTLTLYSKSLSCVFFAAFIHLRIIRLCSRCARKMQFNQKLVEFEDAEHER